MSDVELREVYNEICEEINDSEWGSFEYDSLDMDLRSVVLEFAARGLNFNEG